ncbi:hypothetical protein AB0O34_17525, partial [Sphaerisporangium sp. NPDC088356]
YAQRGPARHRYAQRGPARHRYAQRGPARDRSAKRGRTWDKRVGGGRTWGECPSDGGGRVFSGYASSFALYPFHAIHAAPSAAGAARAEAGSADPRALTSSGARPVHTGAASPRTRHRPGGPAGIPWLRPIRADGQPEEPSLDSPVPGGAPAEGRCFTAFGATTGHPSASGSGDPLPASDSFRPGRVRGGYGRGHAGVRRIREEPRGGEPDAGRFLEAGTGSWHAPPTGARHQ